jgi:hypothetical protein
MGRPLWREDGSIVYICCWSSWAQSFSGPSPARLMTTFNCLRFETPPTRRARSPYLYPPGTGRLSYTPKYWVLFFTSYDSQGYGGGVRTRLHTGDQVNEWMESLPFTQAQNSNIKMAASHNFFKLSALRFIYFCSPNIIGMIKSRRMRRAGHVARMGRRGKPEGKRPLGRPRRRWVDNIKTDLR